MDFSALPNFGAVASGARAPAASSAAPAPASAESVLGSAAKSDCAKRIDMISLRLNLCSSAGRMRPRSLRSANSWISLSERKAHSAPEAAAPREAAQPPALLGETRLLPSSRPLSALPPTTRKVMARGRDPADGTESTPPPSSVQALRSTCGPCDPLAVENSLLGLRERGGAALLAVARRLTRGLASGERVGSPWTGGCAIEGRGATCVSAVRPSARRCGPATQGHWPGPGTPAGRNRCATGDPNATPAP
mmetsp:Transcript_123890/g.264071  ORF Transcript_123890/g.264071 Transcript_123890/m.264071 type:complete len:250 (-) Transcript_123890:329-1078(-)